ncbi:glycosyl transferase group 1 [Natrinema pellirubrum DSM 15624]|uniref:Glycosyl transferase group 1 n=1 Tax=Natrinema pellirubrum (strain DSM 15624 / CIP 106293 / JCM 10476 / NCIMB 786 / 157) TaxID=797303 RepID=L0JL49_NATP1|nr:glycosyltransferase family 4 protein [Natrinema pellirubrum]AGB31999.1 glycosyltransferase [Natrinema pellirubrum DSM 15624]ELY78134.1 glycosyl transferase group 1 [Natrinema pellirubrum DSM 15624]
MKISHYFELEDHVTGGISESVAHQRAMLDQLGLQYTTEPTLEADVFHCNLMGPRSVWYARRARSKGIPVVANTHVTAEDFGDSFRFTNALAKPLKPYLRWAYGLADALVCPSEYNQGLIEGYTDTPTTVISNGVDRGKLEGFDSLEAEYRDRYDLESPTVFLVGHVIKRKGLETFVELARRLPDMDFAWFGPLDLSLKGRETTQLIENAPENCTFTGFIDDIRGAYAAGDIFCFPTHEENEGIALLEAMAAGKPVLVRDIETFSWLEDGADCLKASGDGVAPFVDALERLRDPALRDRLGSNAADRSEAFSLEAVANQYQSLYTAVTP